MPANRGYQLLHSDAFTAELEALGLDSSLFGAAGIPAPVFQCLEPRRAGVYDEHAHTFGTIDEPAVFDRASNGLHRDASGAWVVAGDDVIRADHNANGVFCGYLFEPASTNVFLNSDAPATQSISLGTGTFTLSVHGTGSVTSSNGTGTATGHGAATDGSFVTITVTGAGTFTFTVAGSPTYAQVEELSVPTSPIITAGASATRAADDLRWNNRLSGFDLAEGLIVSEVYFAHPTASYPSNAKIPILSFRSGSYNGTHVMWLNEAGGGHHQLRAQDTATISRTDFTPSAAGVQARCFTRWGSGEYQSGIYIDGSMTWGVLRSLAGWHNDNVAHVGLLPQSPFHMSSIALYNREFSRDEIERLFAL